MLVTANGRELGSFPAELSLTQQEVDTLQAGGEVSGVDRGGVLYAAAGRSSGRNTVIVALTGDARSLLGGAGGWFLLAAAFVVLLAVVVAWRLGGALARPMREATVVTERIAGGDLSARLPEPRPTDRDELAVLSRSVNTMADTLERSRGLEQQFLLSISHDLRTPLTNIRGYAEAIADGAVDEPASAAAVILSESARLERLVQDLLDLGRLESNQFTLRPVPADVTEVAAGAAEAFRAEVEGAGLDLVVQRGGSAPGDADVDRVAQVVGNLVANAVRYARTRIVIDVRPEIGDDRSAVLVQVTDDGPGIPAADLPHVFERLYRATDQPVRAESGSGLGLAIVRDLVGAMGGEVGVTSPPTGGTTVWFRLPAGPA